MRLFYSSPFPPKVAVASTRPEPQKTSYVTGHKLCYLHTKGLRMVWHVTRGLASSLGRNSHIPSRNVFHIS